MKGPVYNIVTNGVKIGEMQVTKTKKGFNGRITYTLKTESNSVELMGEFVQAVMRCGYEVKQS